MPPTTIKLSGELRRRVKRAARDAKMSAHAFMLEAIARETRIAEARREMNDAADAAEAEFDRTGEYYTLEDVATYLDEKITGKKPTLPKARIWPKSSSKRRR